MKTTFIHQIYRVIIVTSILLGSLAAFGQGTHTATYNGGGVWEQDGNWSTIAYPNNGHFVTIAGNRFPDDNPFYDVVIDIAPPCTLGISVNVQSVSVASGSTLNLVNVSGGTRLAAQVAFTNSGLITLSSDGSGAELIFPDGASLSGSGQVVMSDSGTNRLSAINDGDTLTIGPNASITGAGTLNYGSFGGTVHFLNFHNQGVIEATQPTNELSIGLINSNNSNLTNSGILRASGSATLRVRQFGSATVFNTGGLLQAINNGTVRIGPGITVEGGSAKTSNNGTIRGDYPGGGGGILSNLTNKGRVAVGDNETITLANTFINNGSVTLDSTGSGATLNFVDGSTLSGTGAVTLSNNGSNFIMGATNGAVFTIASNASIKGTGSISPGFSGGSNMAKITNQGLIEANNANSSLNIRIENSNNTDLTNSGILRASNGGTLSFSGTGTIFNNGGTISALDQSSVRLAGTVTVSGGTLTSAGSGAIHGGTLSGLTNAGHVEIANSETLAIAGTFTNNGSFTLDSTGGGATLIVDDGSILAGNTPVTFSNNGANFLMGRFGGEAFTIAVGATLQGTGTLSPGFSGGSNLVKITNLGLINANNSGSTLAIRMETTTPFTNKGTLRASAGATLSCFGSAGTLDNTGGTIEALSGSTVSVGSGLLTNYAGTTLTGGRYRAVNGTLALSLGPVVTNNATVILSGPTSVFGPIDSIHENDGTFTLLKGRIFSTATVAPESGDAFIDVGTLQLDQKSSINVNGNYAQGSQSTLFLQIGGNEPNPNFHQLNVTGTARLAGTLKVTFTNGFTPAPNQTFTILKAGAREGGFVNVIGASVTYTDTEVIIGPTNNPAPLELTGAVSRKTHGASGIFELPLDLGAAGNGTVEPRASGPTKIVFTFNDDIAAADGAISANEFTITNATFSSASIQDNTLTLDLTSVTDQSVVSVALNGITDQSGHPLTGDNDVDIRALLGDVDQDGHVSNSDQRAFRAHKGEALNPANFLFDLNLNGIIRERDGQIIRANKTHHVP